MVVDVFPAGILSVCEKVTNEKIESKIVIICFILSIEWLDFEK